MSRYRVMVDDNFHYMDEDERYELGIFSTADEVIAPKSDALRCGEHSMHSLVTL